MQYIKTLYRNKKLIFQLGKNDFRNKFASTSLGAIWGFIQPFVFMITYVIVFQFILKTDSAGDYPYIVWFLPGMSMWMFLNDAIVNASSSIRSYSYLVKKVVFPIDVIPSISLTSSSIIGMFLFLISIIVCACLGYVLNIFKFIYILVAAYCLIIAITRFTSALCTLVPDFANLLTVVMQLFFWFTPIIWNINMLDGSPILSEIMNCMPFTYLVNGFRAVFTKDSMISAGNGLYTIVFWIITIIIFIWGNRVFNRNKKDFADVL